MKKKTLALLCCLLALSLIGCGKSKDVREVEKQIESAVSSTNKLDLREVYLDRALEAYNDLSKADREKVSNYQDLLDSIEEVQAAQDAREYEALISEYSIETGNDGVTRYFFRTFPTVDNAVICAPYVASDGSNVWMVLRIQADSDLLTRYNSMTLEIAGERFPIRYDAKDVISVSGGSLHYSYYDLAFPQNIAEDDTALAMLRTLAAQTDGDDNAFYYLRGDDFDGTFNARLNGILAARTFELYEYLLEH